MGRKATFFLPDAIDVFPSGISEGLSPEPLEAPRAKRPGLLTDQSDGRLCLAQLTALGVRGKAPSTVETAMHHQRQRGR